MRNWAARAAVAALLAGAALAQDAPKSILPPGFDAPAPAPKPVEPKPVPPPIAAPADAAAVPPTGAAPSGAPVAKPVPVAVVPAQPPADPNATGLLSPAAGGYGPATFAGSNGRFLVGLMQRVDAPVASRWSQIVLRRALLSQVPTPAGLRPADWVAERAWLLLRAGEVDGAKALVEAVPVDRYTMRMYAVAAQVDLAAADLPALCPLAPTARTLSREPLWPLIEAMCAGMSGDDLTAASIFDSLRGREGADPFDIKLAERVAAAAGGGGRAANVEWQEVDRLSIYRFGLAVAGGVTPSQELLAKSRPPVRAWLFRAPTAPLTTRLAMAPTAAMLGVSSSDEIVKLYSALGSELDPFELEASPAGQLRLAFSGRTPAARLAAMRTLWTRASDDGGRYAMKILTARAAARLVPDAALADAAPDLVESMLAAGLVRPALRWWPIADAAGGAVRDRTWALLTVAEPRIPGTTKRFEDWQASETERAGEGRAKRRAQLLAAALAGLGGNDGRLRKLLDDLDVAPLDTVWTRRIDAASRAGRIGEVSLLAAIGLQTDWAGVPPRHLAHILAAYRRIGRTHEAHMLAVEALSRG